MKRLRLCFVGWGDHVHVERWAGYFAREGHEVSVVSFSGSGRYPEGVRQYRVGLQGRGPRWIEAKLRYLFWRLRPHLVHVHWAHFAVPVRRAWKGTLVVTAWGSDVYLRDKVSQPEREDLRRALQSADLVTADSDDLARSMVSGLGVASERAEVIQWGVDTDLFSPKGPDLRSRFGLDGRKVVFSVRNFTPIYNQETAVAAFARIREREPAAYLLMKSYGGDSGYLAKIRQQIASSDLEAHCRIVETVPYEQMPDLYRTADVTLSIPFSDAMPMSVLEAMASGCVPVVSDLPSLREWIRDGENGFVVDPRDVGSVTDGILAALAQDGKARTAARQLVLARASQRAHMQLMLSRYQALVGGGAPVPAAR